VRRDLEPDGKYREGVYGGSHAGSRFKGMDDEGLA